jgi:hypothetical protein
VVGPKANHRILIGYVDGLQPSNQGNQLMLIQKTINIGRTSVSTLGRLFPKIFLLGEKSRNNPMQSPVMEAVHYIATKITKQRALRQIAQISLNHHTPDLHTVAPGLRTVVFPQWPYRPLIITNSKQSTVLLDSLHSGPRPGTCPIKKNNHHKHKEY